jgi:hypothetical protein
MKKINFTICSALCALTLLASCSSENTAHADDADAEDTIVAETAAQDAPETLPSETAMLPAPKADASVASGVVVDFFPSEAGKGLHLASLNWKEAISPTNPICDCTLAKRKEGRYSCVAKNAAGDLAVVTASEKGAKLSRIVLDVKGAGYLKSIKKSLAAAGYKVAKGAKTKKNHWLFNSADKASTAELIWVSKTKAVSLVLKGN